MVTFQICLFVYLNVVYHHQEHFFWGEWNDSEFQHIRGGVKVLNFELFVHYKYLFMGDQNTLPICPKSSQTQFCNGGKMVEMWSYFGASTPELATWVDHELGGLASHQCRWAGVVWAPRCRDLRDGLLAGVGCSSLTLRFSWTVTLTILGLGFLRAPVLRLCCTLHCWKGFGAEDVGTMKSLHWRCEMWFNCVEWKRSAT